MGHDEYDWGHPIDDAVVVAVESSARLRLQEFWGDITLIHSSHQLEKKSGPKAWSVLMFNPD